MDNAAPPFGRIAAQCTSPTALLDCERQMGRSERFAPLDALLGALLVQAVGGAAIATKQRDALGVTTVALTSLSHDQRAMLDDLFTLSRQQARGAWFLPHKASLKTGMIDVSGAFARYGRFGSGLAAEDTASVALDSSADALFLWSVLDPLLVALYAPFELRGRQTGVKSAEDQRNAWADIDALYHALGLVVDSELAVMRYGSGWSKLRAAAQWEAKQRLLHALQQQIRPEMGACYRAYRLQLLMANYYKKAKSDGRVKRKQVITKALERAVAGFFGGDWLAVLDYLGEQPHPDEQVVTALPEARLNVGNEGRVAEVAAQLGLPAEEVRRMVDSFWDQQGGKSPVEQRVALLRHYWDTFDAIHAQQAVGMPPLWGLVEESIQHWTFNRIAEWPYQPERYRALIEPDLVGEIERLWGTVVLTRWPERIVTEPFPHERMAAALGPALDFWHGCALTAWFLCEGPSSRTDLPGLKHYYRRELAALQAYDTPVDTRLFADLIAAQARLGPEQQIERTRHIRSVGAGVSVSMVTYAGTHRDGFTILRDIITHHRRAWTTKYLDRYLRARWETAIRGASRAFHQQLSEKGAAPTVKQFSKHAVEPANMWFGGDIAALYVAFGEKAPFQPTNSLLMPRDAAAFVYTLFTHLGGKTILEPFADPKLSQGEREAWIQESDRMRALNQLARKGLWHIQLQEALEQQPTLKEFGATAFEQLRWAISDTTEVAWSTYNGVIAAAQRKHKALPKRFRRPMYEIPRGAQMIAVENMLSPETGVVVSPSPATLTVTPQDGNILTATSNVTQPASPNVPSTDTTISEKPRSIWSRIVEFFGY